MPVFYAVGDAGSQVDEDVISASGLVVNVGQTDRNDGADDRSRSASGRGLDLVAPGYHVYTASVGFPSGGGPMPDYGDSDGSSNAAPCAAGVAALVRAANRGLNAQRTVAVLRATCRKIGTRSYQGGLGWNDLYGYGRVDAGAAVALADALR
jgi:thermitase